MPKTVKLQPHVIVKSLDAEALPGSTVTGKRIVMCGTTDEDTPRIYIAIYNSVYNVTEYVYQEPSDVPEKCRAIEIDPYNGQILFISDRQSADPIVVSPARPLKNQPATWHVAVRAFSVQRKYQVLSRK